MRTNYVLIDFESVQPASLELLAQEHFKVIVFLGAHQKVPVKLAQSLQPLGPRADYIQISGHGPNALDFHIAYYIGQLAAKEQPGYFHIISKDMGFDPLIQHLRSNKIFAGRVELITDIPVLRALNCKSQQERIDYILARLNQPKATKPRTVKSLSSAIASMFSQDLREEQVASLVQTLEKRGHLKVDGTKVTYALPANGLMKKSPQIR